MRWGEIYKKIGTMRHHFDAVAHEMVRGCQSMKDPCPPEVIDQLIVELEGELMELMDCRNRM